MDWSIIIQSLGIGFGIGVIVGYIWGGLTEYTRSKNEKFDEENM